MKKLICFLMIVLFGSSFADVVKNRYDDEMIHFGMPSWVTINQGKNKNQDIISEEFVAEYDNSTTIDRKKKIDLPESHKIRFMGKEYNSIVVHNTGYIEFGAGKTDYEKVPTVYPVGYSSNIIEGNSFKWGLVSQKIDAGTNKEKIDRSVVVTFGPFSQGAISYYGAKTYYSIQVRIFEDGEVQIQYWDHDADKKSYATHQYQTWMKPLFFDGYRVHSVSEFDLKNQKGFVYLYGENGLRDGWIAKALKSDYNLSISENQVGAGLRVNVPQVGSDEGGIIAYDYSRENPVIGGFSSVEIETSGLPTTYFEPLYCWYFQEYNTTHFSGSSGPEYPFLSQNVHQLVLTKDNYSHTLSEYKTKLNRDDASLDFLMAPAFKFQRDGYSSSIPEYSFTIKSIKYNLRQPQSIQFLPVKSKHQLIVNNGVGGVTDVAGLKGTVDKYDSHKKAYDLYTGQEIDATITASPGYEIDEIIVTYASNGISVNSIYTNGKVQTSYVAGLQITSSEKEKVTLKGSLGLIVQKNIVISVTYKKCTDRILDYVVPSIVRTDVYTAPSTTNVIKSASSAVVLNGFGGVAQKQNRISEKNFAVSAVYTNGMNQQTVVPLSFVHEAKKDEFEYVDMACKGCVSEANAYYRGQSEIDQPNAEDHAFVETKFFNANSQKDGSTYEKAGVASRSFEIKSLNSDYNTEREWVMTAISDHDFIDNDKLDIEFFKNSYESRTNKPDYQQNFVLKVSRSANGKYAQFIYNSIGQLVSSWVYNGKRPVITLYKYDDDGNLLKNYVENYESLALERTYDAQGRIVSVQSNDRGLTESKYNSKGQLRYIRSSYHTQKSNDDFTVLFYDEFGRRVAIGEAHGLSETDFENPDKKIDSDKLEKNAYVRFRSKLIYGLPDNSMLVNLGVNQTLVDTILNAMNGIRPNDIGAEISFDETEKPVTIRLSDYSRLGKKLHQWLIYCIDKLPAIKLQYSYDSNGEMNESTFSQWDGTNWIEKNKRNRFYDAKGRLTDVNENGKKLASYKYSKNGNVETKTYYDDNGIAFEKTIHNDIYGRVETIEYKDKNGNELYTNNLVFENVEDNKVHKASNDWKNVENAGDISREANYEYDYSGRLTSVTGSLSGLYGYDVLGRMERKIEGDTAIGYSYYNQTYRPYGFSVNGSSPSGRLEYLKYDAAGNVWYDAHNKVVYKNNVAGMPVKITAFETMPSNIGVEDVYNATSELDGAIASIDIAYDENNERAWYSYNDFEKKKSYTEVSIPGVGVYKAQKENGTNKRFELVRMDLIGGGYRDASGNAYFPVMDAQGNVRSYATSSNLKSAYDYYPYGAVKELAAGDNDEKRWQDKEFDGEHRKYYFGSRYFDPFFALWMSPDPAAQFANPYTYGGDPVNYVDPNGEEIALAVVVTGAIIGAIIGGGTASYQCSKYGAGSCGTAVSTGAIVGAAAGAAGGAAGGAASGLSAAAAGAAGLGSGSGVVAAMAGGAVEGAISGAASSAVSYTTTYLLGKTDWDWSDFGLSMAMGTIGGGLMGGATSALRYGISDGFKWKTHETVINYANETDKLAAAVKYVAPGDYSVEFTDLAVSSEYNPETNKVTLLRSDYIEDGKFSFERFWNAAEHEGGHYKLSHDAFKSINAQNGMKYANFKEWVDSYEPGKWQTIHRWPQEQILKSPQNIRFYDLYSKSLQGYMDDLLKKAIEQNAGDMRFVNEYQFYGYKY